MAYGQGGLRCILGLVRQRKWLVIPALIAVGCLVLLGVLMLLPTPKTGFEPDWLLKLPPTSDKQTVYLLNQPLASDIVVTQRAWIVKNSRPENMSQLNRAFSASNGWTKNAVGRSVTWRKLDLKTSQGFTFSLFRDGSELHIQTHTSRPLSWLEKTQRSLRKFFGVQEK